MSSPAQSVPWRPGRFRSYAGRPVDLARARVAV